MAASMMKWVQYYQLNIAQFFMKICIINKRKTTKNLLLIILEGINSSTVHVHMCIHACLFASFF